MQYYTTKIVNKTACVYLKQDYVFIPDANAEFGVRQEFVLAGVITGTAKSECWTGKAETVDFFDLKGDLESILSLTEVGSRVKFVAKAHSAFAPRAICFN